MVSITYPVILVPSLHHFLSSFDHSTDLATRAARERVLEVGNDRFLPLGLLSVLLGSPGIVDNAHQEPVFLIRCPSKISLRFMLARSRKSFKHNAPCWKPFSIEYSTVKHGLSYGRMADRWIVVGTREEPTPFVRYIRVRHHPYIAQTPICIQHWHSSGSDVVGGINIFSSDTDQSQGSRWQSTVLVNPTRLQSRTLVSLMPWLNSTETEHG